MQNAGLDEAQAGIKIAGRNINNLRYADDTTLMGESEEGLKRLLKMKEESEKAGLKLNIQKMKTIASSPITWWQIDGKTVETVTDFIFLGSKITADSDCSHEIKRHLLLGRKVMTNLDDVYKGETLLCQKYPYSPVVMYVCELDHKKPGMLQLMESQSQTWLSDWKYLWLRMGHNWQTENSLMTSLNLYDPLIGPITKYNHNES